MRGRWLSLFSTVAGLAVAIPVGASLGAGRRSLSASSARVRVLDVLSGNGIGSVRFGASPSAVRNELDSLLRQSGGRYRPGGSCDLDHQMTWSDHGSAPGWPALTVFFRHSAFAGYQFGDPNRPGYALGGSTLATTRGLRLGDTLLRGRRLYGQRFSLSTAQGGSWNLHTAGGRLMGYAYGRPSHGDVSWQSVVLTIDAGDVGCAALTP